MYVGGSVPGMEALVAEGDSAKTTSAFSRAIGASSSFARGALLPNTYNSGIALADAAVKNEIHKSTIYFVSFTNSATSAHLILMARPPFFETVGRSLRIGMFVGLGITMLAVMFDQHWLLESDEPKRQRCTHSGSSQL